MKDIVMRAPFFTIGLFLAMLLMMEIGRWYGRRLTQQVESAPSGLDTSVGTIFALLGLLIAFTFSGAATRFDARRQLITEEANTIGTAWLRIDLLPENTQPPLRQLFRQYLDSRLETYRKFPDIPAVEAEFGRSRLLQNQIWNQAVKACRDSGSTQAFILLLPALNSMIDITTTRIMSAQFHPPRIIFVMLGIMSLAAALLAGYDMAAGKKRSWIHMIVFAAAIAIAVYVIIDIEYPRVGFIQLNSADKALQDLRQTMN